MTDRHHRRPKWFRGPSDKWNLMTVDARRHSAFHYLFQVNGHPMTPEQIAIELSEKWIDPAYVISIRQRSRE